MTKTRKDIIGVLGILSILIITILTGAYIGLDYGERYDRVTLCKIRGDIRENRIIIVDKTDPIPPLALRNLRETILEQRELLAVQDRLWIFAMSSDGVDLSKPIFSRCRPHTREDASALNSDPDSVEQQYNDSFEAPLDTALKTLETPDTAAYSPILETIGRVTASPLFGNRGSRHIIFVTDLLQNSHMFSVYGRGWKRRPKPESIGDEMRLGYGDVFDKVELRIRVIERYGNGVPNEGELREYWRALLKATGMSNFIIRIL
jgi:hypothetical protein